MFGWAEDADVTVHGFISIAYWAESNRAVIDNLLQAWDIGAVVDNTGGKQNPPGKNGSTVLQTRCEGAVGFSLQICNRLLLVGNVVLRSLASERVEKFLTRNAPIARIIVAGWNQLSTALSVVHEQDFAAKTSEVNCCG